MNRSLPILSAVGAVLALAACDRPAAKPVEAPAAAAPVAPAEWALGMGRTSVELAHLPAGGDHKTADLRLVCAAGAGFQVSVPGFTPVASEERLTIGSGDHAFALAATAATTGVQATGPIADDLLAVFDSGGPISINHGDQNIGPISAPPDAARRIFTETCRKLRKEAAV